MPQPEKITGHQITTAQELALRNLARAHAGGAVRPDGRLMIEGAVSYHMPGTWVWLMAKGLAHGVNRRVYVTGRGKIALALLTAARQARAAA